MILQQYASDHHFPNPCFYVDDGYSGASFQRPGFQQMMADMENGEIGIIITKDLSRLGRNQLHTGLYIEETIEIHYSDIGWIGGEDLQDKKSPRQEISA